jgi:hypothetical protein
MDIPYIPDDRPHKTGSMRSYSPTIVLDEAALEAEMHSKGLNQDFDDEPNGVNQSINEHVRHLNINREER